MDVGELKEKFAIFKEKSSPSIQAVSKRVGQYTRKTALSNRQTQIPLRERSIFVELVCAEAESEYDFDSTLPTCLYSRIRFFLVKIKKTQFQSILVCPPALYTYTAGAEYFISNP